MVLLLPTGTGMATASCCTGMTKARVPEAKHLSRNGAAAAGSSSCSSFSMQWQIMVGWARQCDDANAEYSSLLLLSNLIWSGQQDVCLALTQPRCMRASLFCPCSVTHAQREQVWCCQANHIPLPFTRPNLIQNLISYGKVRTVSNSAQARHALHPFTTCLSRMVPPRFTSVSTAFVLMASFAARRFSTNEARKS